MNDRAIVQAGIMAITAQNVTPRAAPNSTTLMQGMVINRNIAAGETVCCYEYTGAELLRLGDVPTYATNFFVDDNNQMYDVSDGVLRIRDGLSGEVIGNTTPAYGFVVNAGDGVCAYKSSDEDNTWVMIYRDGEMSNDITFAFESTNIVIGYANGILAVAPNTGGNGWTTYTYTKDGTLLRTLATVASGYPWTRPSVLFPVTESLVGALVWGLYGIFDQRTISYYFLIGPSEVTNKGFPFEDYYSPSLQLEQGCDYLGRDQEYFWLMNRLHDPDTGQYLDTWLVAKFSIENYDIGPTEIARYGSAPTYYGTASQYGHFVRAHTVGGSTVRQMLDIETMSEVYAGLLETPESMTIVRENERFLWIAGSGVYQKMVLGWLMYATNVYPRSSPYGRLGYAVRPANIGTTGLAVVLFE